MINVPDGVGREVLYEVIDSHIAIVTLNRPEVRNAVNVPLAQAMDFLARKAEADGSIRAVILASSNDRAFCAGADLSEIANGRGDKLQTDWGGFAGLIDAPRKKPWIAAVGGFALGGGCELALACDMIIASENAKFGLPEVKRGLMAGAGGVHRLPRALPRNLALELIATGEPIDAAAALAHGMVNRVVPIEQVLSSAITLAKSIAANAPLAVMHSLAVARQSAECTDADLRVLSRLACEPVFSSADAQEGARAFLEKRRANWKGC